MYVKFTVFVTNISIYLHNDNIISQRYIINIDGHENEYTKSFDWRELEM